MWHASVIFDDVTTTDELIPSGETSSYRSNPIRLAEFTLGRKDPEFVQSAKDIVAMDAKIKAGQASGKAALDNAVKECGLDMDETIVAPFIYANKPGDGSAREQAASCQKVLGVWANVATDYATKRYRSNCVNWGMIPFVVNKGVMDELERYDVLSVPGIRQAMLDKKESVTAYHISENGKREVTLSLPAMSDDEREILLEGCLINYYRANKSNKH